MDTPKEISTEVDRILAKRAVEKRARRAVATEAKRDGVPTAKQTKLPKKLGFNQLRSLRLAVERGELTEAEIFQRFGVIL